MDNNRQIKFRAWDKFNGCYHYQQNESLAGLATFFKMIADYKAAGNEIILERWSGLTDKEGNEIYESDRWGAIDGLKLEGTIVMHEGSWSIKWGNGYYGDLWAHVRTKAGKIVGTIHQ